MLARSPKPESAPCLGAFGRRARPVRGIRTTPERARTTPKRCLGGEEVGRLVERCFGSPIHDLRHTAACLWLAKGVDPVTVQAWLGHASIATTNIYLHHLGSSADRVGLARLNTLGSAGGAREDSNVE